MLTCLSADGSIDDAEVAADHEDGRHYLDELATEIQDSAPAAKESNSAYRQRDVTKEFADLVTATVNERRAQHVQYDSW